MWLVALAGPPIAAAASDDPSRFESPPADETRDGRPTADTVTFTRNIAPIMFEHCTACHRPDGWAPFSLESYQSVRKRARQIATVTKIRFMPPWLPEPGHGAFIGERRLDDEQIETIAQWVAQGAVRGDPADRPAPPSWTEGWHLGEPDLVIRMEQPYTLRAGGTDVFRNFVISIPVEQQHYVKAVELHPGNGSIVHHAVMRIDRTASSRRLDAKDPDPGYQGMLFSAAKNPDGYLLGWTPGRVPSTTPEGMAWRLQPDSDLVLELHMMPTGKPEEIQSEIGFYFTDQVPTRFPVGLMLESTVIDIPPGVTDYTVKDSYVLPVDVEVMGVYPHAHYLGKQIEATAVLPDGTRRWLIHIRDWDFNWQDEYWYQTPIFLPKGTTLSMRYTYDNSADNLRNPHDPPRRVVYGGQTFDEMGNFWLQVLPRNPQDREILDRDFVTQSYEKLIRDHPDDPVYVESYLGLGDERRRQDNLDAAIDLYRQALRLKPDYAEAHNNLGQTLRRQGRTAEAISHLRQALHVERDDARAVVHDNLGQILHLSGQRDESIQHFRKAVRLNPDFAGAQLRLGKALYLAGRTVQALKHFREAIRLRLDTPEPLNDAAWVLATHRESAVRDGAEAVRLAERAAELTDHKNTDILDTLAAAYAEVGRFAEAVTTAQRALKLALAEKDDAQIKALRARLKLYERQEPYREPAAH